MMLAFPDTVTIPRIAETKIILTVARLAKEFGAWPPLRVADEVYHLFKPGYLDKFSPEERVLADMRIFARLIEAENEAHEKRKDKPKLDSHPGLVRRLSLEDHKNRQKD